MAKAFSVPRESVVGITGHAERYAGQALDSTDLFRIIEVPFSLVESFNVRNRLGCYSQKGGNTKKSRVVRDHSMPAGLASILMLLLYVIVMPILIADVMIIALEKMGFDLMHALIIVLAIFIGSLFNIPLKRYPATGTAVLHTENLYGLAKWFPQQTKQAIDRVIAVNAGGCVVPCLVVFYEIFRMSSNLTLLLALSGVVILNVGICYRFSRVVPDKGVMMPALLPGLVAAFFSIVVTLSYPPAEHFTPAIAYCAGVMGPLIGADLIRIRSISQLGSGVASIGGAGTFDGIVISGFIALLVA